MSEPDQTPGKLDGICIAMPCSVDWDSMKGNDEVRLCGGCNKNVYNISAMSKKRAEEILSGPQLPCLVITRTQDGRLINDECPGWLKPFRNSWRKTLSIAVSLLTLISIGSQAKAQNQQPAAIQNSQPSKDNILAQHAGVPFAANRWKSVKTAPSYWPASISGLGFSKEDLPLTLSEKFTPEQINAIDSKKIALDAVPPQLDKAAWELFFKARKLHLKASMHFVNKEMDKATHECQESQKLYQLALEQISRGKHDDAFAALVYQEQNKITQMEEQCRKCLITVPKQK